MNRFKTAFAAIVSLISVVAIGQNSSQETILKDTIQIQKLEGSLLLTPVKASDTLEMVTYPEVDTYDQRFQDLLYNHDGFDYLFDKNIANIDSLDVTDVALSTDTLKARLQRINQSTPFQIDYNPILENLIKKKLKYNKVYLERIMTLSDYYFPLF